VALAPEASAIVRVKDEARTLERTFRSLRAQTVDPEIVVVDSGSRDGSLEIVRQYCDQLVEIPASQFTYGRALNIGAQHASAAIHFALSAHCHAPHDDWIAGTLAHYDRSDVAGVCGIQAFPDRTPACEPFTQDAAFAASHPRWGFSNHASSWRASVWARFPFTGELDYTEDKEWAHRVLRAGWVIVFDPRLWVDMSHAWPNSREVYRRQRRAGRATLNFVDIAPYHLRDLARDCWRETPPDRRSPFFHRFINYRRMAGPHRPLPRVRPDAPPSQWAAQT
jgi:rhamnosyltransferase